MGPANQGSTGASAKQEQERRALLKSALEAVDRLQARVDAAERVRTEPIAIIGVGCRFPGGVTTPDEYWQLLAEGRDAIREAPEDRWTDAAYRRLDPAAETSTRPLGGYVDGMDLFDPQFFGIAPREAITMDPQQRLVLEVSWEAMERAGYAPDRLAGQPVGVFVGITTSDYAQVLRDADPRLLDVYFATGNAHNASAGRLAYVLGLRGPAMAIDTACSSSLTAVHTACQSLRSRDASMAIAGGVNAILVPDAFVCFQRWGMMAPDGRCKTFDRTADGFVRSEGCGIVVLRRLSDAIADGDPIVAVIRGSSVNQDGASGGLTVPNGLAQQAVLTQALAAAGLKPADVDYIEAHGTGTSLGDPIELEAIDAVFGPGRPAERPLVVGSVKTNLGHLESASGVAGLLKVVLSLQREAIPPHLHFEALNPRITLRFAPLVVPSAGRVWARGDAVRRAGVSSFGFSGTNAHALLEEAPTRPAPPETDRCGRACWRSAPAARPRSVRSRSATVTTLRGIRTRAGPMRATRPSSRALASHIVPQWWHRRRQRRHRRSTHSLRGASRPGCSSGAPARGARSWRFSSPVKARSLPAWAARPSTASRYFAGRSNVATSCCVRRWRSPCSR